MKIFLRSAFGIYRLVYTLCVYSTSEQVLYIYIYTTNSNLNYIEKSEPNIEGYILETRLARKFLLTEYSIVRGSCISIGYFIISGKEQDCSDATHGSNT